jgi:4-amino-4-deoxy-L-arabinose transferase-like glycosyltransferase
VRRFALLDATIVVGVLGGVALRLWILLTHVGTLDGDEAVWGLMARHFSDGHLTTFFWGQSYGGTEETILTVPVLWVFGSSATAVRAVPLVLWGAAAILVWRIGRRTLGPDRAATAAVLFWCGSAYFVWKSTRAHGFYGSGLVLGLAAVLLALRLRERDSPAKYAALGLAVGLGWWATPQTAILTLPAVAWLVWQRPQALRGAAIAVPAFVLGSLPWWIFNVRHGWDSLRPSVDATTKADHFHNLFSATLPAALGLRIPWSLAWVLSPLGPVLYGLLLLAFAYLLVRRPRGTALFVIAALVFPVLYTLSSYTWLNEEPRYLSLFFPVLALLVATAATTPRRAAVLVACALALSVFGISRVEHSNLAAQEADGRPVPSDLRPLRSALTAHGVTRAYAGYWIAFPVTFESRERIVVATVDDLTQQRYRVRDGRVEPILGTGAGSEGRYPPYNRTVARARNAAHIFVSGASGEERVRPLFLAHGYRLLRAGGFDVYLRRRGT